MSASAAARRAATPLPRHDYATDHRLYKARAEFPKRRLRAAITPSGEVALTRIREFGYDLGYDFNGLERGWVAEVARILGINERTAWAILCSPEITRVSTVTVDIISRNTGIPPRVFYDRDC